MPESKTLRQRGFMRKAAADPQYAAIREIPHAVAKEFRAADVKKMSRKHKIHYLNGKTHAA